MHGKLLAYMNANSVTKIRLAEILGYSYVGVRKKFSDEIPFNTEDAKKLCVEFNKKFEDLF